MYILLDNAAKHGHREWPRTRVSCELSDNRLQIVVMNELPEGIDLEAIGRRAAQLSCTAFTQAAASTDVQSEGGTGYAKLRHILARDLALPQYEVVCAVEGKSFVARLILPSQFEPQ